MISECLKNILTVTTNKFIKQHISELKIQYSLIKNIKLSNTLLEQFLYLDINETLCLNEKRFSGLFYVMLVLNHYANFTKSLNACTRFTRR